MTMPDTGRSEQVRGWVGEDAIKRMRTPGPTGPGFELGWLQEIARSIFPKHEGGQMYLTRDLRDKIPGSSKAGMSFCWRIWDQQGKCYAFRMTAAR